MAESDDEDFGVAWSSDDDFETQSILHLADHKRALDRATNIHNEKTKLTANFVSTTAAGIFGGGFVLPLVSLSFPLTSAPLPGQISVITMIVWAIMGVIIHWRSRDVLDKME